MPPKLFAEAVVHGTAWPVSPQISTNQISVHYSILHKIYALQYWKKIKTSALLTNTHVQNMRHHPWISITKSFPQGKLVPFIFKLVFIEEILLHFIPDNYLYTACIQTINIL